MNIIFITLSNQNNLKEWNIYADLMRKFREEGHNVYIVSPCERRTGEQTHLIDTDGVKILKVRTLNIQKTSVIEKGIGTLLIEGQFKRAIKKYLRDVNFDLITYSTPPITFTNVVKYLKKSNPKAISYLQLKDIFPQNAVDIGMFDERSLFNKYFRKKEVELYKTSDFIGCMSPANVDFLLKHNTFLGPKRVEVAPNSIELRDENEEARDANERIRIREKYGLPTDRPIFIYGGNLGKPQGIDFLIKCLNENATRGDCFFLIIGNGTEYGKLEAWYKAQQAVYGSKLSVKLMQRLPKEDYNVLVRSCNVGLIFLDHRFTIPNYPSRLLSYLENRMPVICATDLNTDIGRIAETNEYGYWCESTSTINFTMLINKILSQPTRIKEMGEKGYQFLKQNYTVQNTYDAIMKHFK